MEDHNEETSPPPEEEEKEEIIPPVQEEKTGEEYVTSQNPFCPSTAPKVQKKPDLMSSQHHSFPSNNWGGASPLLSNNIPPESLEIAYEKLDTIRSYDDLFVPPSPYVAPDDPVNKGEEIELEKDPFLRLFLKMKDRKWRFPKLDPKSRWPQGWC